MVKTSLRQPSRVLIEHIVLVTWIVVIYVDIYVPSLLWSATYRSRLVFRLRRVYFLTCWDIILRYKSQKKSVLNKTQFLPLRNWKSKITSNISLLYLYYRYYRSSEGEALVLSTNFMWFLHFITLTSSPWYSFLFTMLYWSLPHILCWVKKLQTELFPFFLSLDYRKRYVLDCQCHGIPASHC